MTADLSVAYTLGGNRVAAPFFMLFFRDVFVGRYGGIFGVVFRCYFFVSLFSEFSQV
jgi:hypothetical protein